VIQAAAALHLRGEETGRLARVEAIAALIADPFQRGGQIGLHQGVARRVRLSFTGELGQGGRVVAERLQPPGQRARQALAHLETIARQDDRGLDQAGPRGGSVLLVGLGEARHRAGDAHREVAAVVDPE
jgi:hypothetical protein